MKFAFLFALFLLPTVVSGLLKTLSTIIDTILPSPVAPAPAPTTPTTTTTTCQCRSDYDCSKSCGGTCVFSPYSWTGTCKKPPTKPPTKGPTKAPTRAPTRPPVKPTSTGTTGGCPCQFDYQCIQSCPYTNKCVLSPYSGGQGQCQNVVDGPPVATPTPAPIQTTPQCCLDPRRIPTECEVCILIEIMEQAVGINFACRLSGGQTSRADPVPSPYTAPFDC